jgi:hypothetical protein
VGMELGKGKTMEQIAAEMFMVAEGAKSAPAVMALAEEHGVDMPICPRRVPGRQRRDQRPRRLPWPAAHGRRRRKQNPASPGRSHFREFFHMTRIQARKLNVPALSIASPAGLC